MPTNQCDIETSALNVDDTFASFGAMAEPLLSRLSQLGHFFYRNKLRERCYDILKDTELFIVDVPEGEGKEKLSAALAQLWSEQVFKAKGYCNQNAPMAAVDSPLLSPNFHANQPMRHRN